MGNQQVKPRILLVDDEHAVWQILGEKLSRSGFDWRGFSDPREALAFLDKEHFDAVVSDLKMPGMTGLDLLSETQTRHPHLAFVMATGEDDIRVAVDAMKHGADDYLVKPFHLDAAVESVRRALQKKRMEAELERYRHQLEDMVERRTHQLQLAMKRIEHAYDETLEALGAALDLRDTETAGHSRRVSLYCLEIARAIGCTSEQLKTIARGAYLHDIGKIGINDEVLRKPGKLNDDEFEHIKTHVEIGYRILVDLRRMSHMLPVVLHHHESWDGSGYPDGLRGEEIALAARVFAAVEGINIRMISQGASEINITFVIDEQDVPEAVRRLHAVFFADPDPEVFA